MKISHLLKKTSIVFLFRLMGMGLSYVAILLITNMYGAEVYGRFSLSQTVLQFLILLFSLGLGVSAVKLTSDSSFYKNGSPQNDYLKNSLYLILVSALVCVGLLFLLKDILAIWVFKDIELIPYFNYITGFFVFVVLQDFFAEFLRGRSKFFQYSLFKYLFPPLLFVLFLLVFKALEVNHDSVMLSYVLGLGLLSLVLIGFFPLRKMITTTKYSYHSLLSLSFPMMFSAAFLFLSNWTDVLMLGAMVSKTEVGIYNAAYKLAILALIVINAVNTVLAPKISALNSEQNYKAIGKEVQHATKLITLGTLPIVLVLVAFPSTLLSLFGPEFVEGKLVLIIVAVGLLFNALSGSVGQVLNMTKHQNELKKFTLISVIVNVVLNIILIKQMGIIGAAIASLVSNVTLNILCVVFIKKQMGFYAFFMPWKS